MQHEYHSLDDTTNRFQRAMVMPGMRQQLAL